MPIEKFEIDQDVVREELSAKDRVLIAQSKLSQYSLLNQEI
ncbi:MAG: hypothetical protein SFT91_02300 [Rickettsiaceae bacterium]|nr:hypothetical protein [Rickettsiaceae bacterium]